MDKVQACECGNLLTLEMEDWDDPDMVIIHEAFTCMKCRTDYEYNPIDGLKKSTPMNPTTPKVHR